MEEETTLMTLGVNKFVALINKNNSLHYFTVEIMHNKNTGIQFKKRLVNIHCTDRLSTNISNGTNAIESLFNMPEN